MHPGLPALAQWWLSPPHLDRNAGNLTQGAVKSLHCLLDLSICTLYDAACSQLVYNDCRAWTRRGLLAYSSHLQQEFSAAQTLPLPKQATA